MLTTYVPEIDMLKKLLSSHISDIPVEGVDQFNVVLEYDAFDCIMFSRLPSNLTKRDWEYIRCFSHLKKPIRAYTCPSKYQYISR